MISQEADTIVIGGGLMGLSTALALAARGQCVHLIETHSIARHASSASAGGVRSLNRHPDEIALARAALPLWQRLSHELGHDCGFVASGQIRVAQSEEALQGLQARQRLCASLGFEHEQLIDANDLYRRLPHLAPGCRGALVVEDDGFADGLPILAPSRKAPGLIHAFGFSAHGFALLPLIGPLVADLVEGCKINLPIEALRIDRFNGSRSSEVA